MAVKELCLEKFEEAYNIVQKVVLPTNLYTVSILVIRPETEYI